MWKDIAGSFESTFYKREVLKTNFLEIYQEKRENIEKLDVKDLWHKKLQESVKNPNK